MRDVTPPAGRAERAPFRREEVLSAIGGVMGLLAAGEVAMVAERGGLDEEDLRRGLVAYEGQLRPYPDQFWSWLDERCVLAPVPGATGAEHEVVVPLWTDTGPADRGLRLRLTPLGSRGLDACVVGFEDVAPDPGWAVMTVTPSSGAYSDGDPAPRGNSIPERWRTALRELVYRLVRGDYEGLARDGILPPAGHPVHDMVTREIHDYPGRLVDLPDEAWAWASHDPPDHGPGRYAVLLGLWVAHDHPSHLTLEADVDDRGSGGTHLQVIGVHVL